MSDFDLRYSALRRAIIENEFDRMNEMQKQAVLKTEGPLLLLAGAGSGKTTVLINRIINLLRFGRAYESETAPDFAGDYELSRLALAVDSPENISEDELISLCAVQRPRPWEIIAITFTNKAAAELRSRLELACGAQGQDIWAHTFHTACTRILRRDIERLGYPKAFTIYDEDDKKRMLTAVLKDLNLDEKKYDVKSIGFEISRAKDSLVSPKQYAIEVGEDFYKKTVARVFSAYQTKMQDAGALDFDDIICKTVQLLTEHDDIRSYYQQKFRYVLVDEYQDTNHAQYMLCSLLAGGWKNLCVVGDDDQSIYKFRGATIENIMSFEQQYPDAMTIRLEQNYRSTGNILQAANKVISNNFGRKGKTLWTENGDGAQVECHIAENQDEEAQYIAKSISQKQGQGVNLNNCAVLYRNHALSNAVEQAFKRAGLPYRIVSGLRFFDRAEVKDMLAYLWLINNPADTVRLRRVINNPPRKIGAKTLETVAQLAVENRASEFGIAENAKSYEEFSKGAAQALVDFADIINKLIAKKFDTPLMELYDELLSASGYLAALESQSTIEAKGRIDNIMELRSSIAQYVERQQSPTLEGFMEEMALLSEVDRYDDQASAVVMMTMHSAKGLEFDNVYLCGIEEGIFPSYRSMESEAEIEEERRLCYVAMTRAKKHLHITCARRRMLYGKTDYAKPSRFIGEIPDDYLNKTEQKASPYGGIGAVPSYPKSPQYTPKKQLSSLATKTVQTIAFKRGQRIMHKAFGEGSIIEVTPMGGDTLIEVQFDAHGTKRMMAKTASQFIKPL